MQAERRRITEDPAAAQRAHDRRQVAVAALREPRILPTHVVESQGRAERSHNETAAATELRELHCRLRTIDATMNLSWPRDADAIRHRAHAVAVSRADNPVVGLMTARPHGNPDERNVSGATWDAYVADLGEKRERIVERIGVIDPGVEEGKANVDAICDYYLDWIESGWPD